MGKRNKVERVLKDHYRDLLELNQSFIQAIARPQFRTTEMLNSMPKTRKKLTKKQLKALEQGRKKLASKRSKSIQI